MAESKTKKPQGVKKLKGLIPKKPNYIIVLPDEIEDGLHWLFWVFTLLVVLFMASVIVINFTDIPKTLSLLF